MLTSYYTALHIDFLRQLDDGLAWEFEETLCADNAAPVEETKIGGALSEPFLVCDTGTVPDDTGVLDIEFLGETIDAKKSKVWDIVYI